MYQFDPQKDSEIKRVYITGASTLPEVISPSMVKYFYHYDSGSKEFKIIPANKNFSIAVDAIALHGK